MKSRWHSIAVVVLLAISASLLLGSVAPSSQVKGDVDSLKAALKQAGFLVPQKDSVLASFDMPSEVCCPANAKFKCMYNNVNVPYLVSKVEPGPGEVTVPLPNNNFHLGQNEALILIGQTPPPMAYFSYTVFMGSRRTTRFPYNFGIFSLVNAYVADSINNMTVHTSGPPNDPFNRQMLLFIVADQEVEARVARRRGRPAILPACSIPSSCRRPCCTSASMRWPIASSWSSARPCRRSRRRSMSISRTARRSSA